MPDILGMIISICQTNNLNSYNCRGRYCPVWQFEWNSQRRMNSLQSLRIVMYWSTCIMYLIISKNDIYWKTYLGHEWADLATLLPALIKNTGSYKGVMGIVHCVQENRFSEPRQKTYDIRKRRGTELHCLV